MKKNILIKIHSNINKNLLILVIGNENETFIFIIYSLKDLFLNSDYTKKLFNQNSI